MNYLNEFKSLLFHPRAFFEKSRSDKDEQKPIRMAVIGMFFFLFLSTVISLGVLNFLSGLVSTISPTGSVLQKLNEKYDSVYFQWVYRIIDTSLAILLIPVFHWIFKKLGSKKSKADTVRVIFYPLSYFFIIGWIPIVSMIAPIVHFYFLYLAGNIFLEFDWKKFILLVLTLVPFDIMTLVIAGIVGGILGIGSAFG